MSFFRGYYNHPEGEDAYGKMVATNRLAVTAGLAWSTFDVLLYSKTQGYWPTIARIGYNTLPMMGMASAFTMTTYIATRARGKDDRWNYFLGGLAAGSIYGAWKRNVAAGATAALFLGAAATLKKLSKQEGWEFFPDFPHGYGTLNSPTHDFTVTDEREKGWTTKA